MAWLKRLRGVGSLTSGRPAKASGIDFHPSTITAAALVATLGVAAVLAIGCGNEYRPVITPIQPTGPAPAPTAGVMVVSQPGFGPIAPGLLTPCTGGPYATPSVITLVDFSGDSISAQANGGNGPLSFSLEAGGADVYAPDCDGTLIYAIATAQQLLTKNVESATLLPGSAPTNTLFANSNLYVTESGLHGPTCLSTNCVAQLAGSPIGLKQEIPVAPSLINLTGYSVGERIYAISQGNSGGGTQPSWGDCDSPSSVSVNGEADAIETVTNTISARLPLGVCPVFGFQTPDLQRAFIMNRGSGTVTVINTQLNAIDSAHPTITVGAGPVYADYYRTGQVLVTANYDSNTISIIDVSLDQYGNDSATFGTVLATVPVGLNPVEVSVLEDGSRVYVANQGDIAAGDCSGVPCVPGSVSIVNLVNYSVEKTIALTSNPHAIASIYNYPTGKVYVASQNSPYLTVIRTDTDIVSATPEMQGNIVDMRVSAQYPAQATTGASNYQTESRSVGSGAP
jgi:DNA-binding beta-propeller fold protein YncE